MKTRILSLLMALILLISLTPAAAAASSPFSDVAEGDWFCNPVLWAVENGITDGLTPDTFGPDVICTRSQVVTFLWAAAGKPAPTAADTPFTDVSASDWFYHPVLWAVENGITTGLTPDTFGPESPCTRSQVVTFLYAAAGRPEASNANNPFTDVSTSDWFAVPVLWAVENGITTGLTPDTFGPNTDCTRGQIVTFLYAARNVASKPEVTPTPTPESHIHSYKVTSTVAPTCTADGKQVEICTGCGDMQNAVLTKLGHSYSTVTTDATCTAASITKDVCTLCGDTKNISSSPALGHDWGDATVIKEPTCTQSGFTEKTCSRCDIKSAESIAATGHSYKTETTDATCVTEGISKDVCTVCGHITNITTIPVVNEGDCISGDEDNALFGSGF